MLQLEVTADQRAELERLRDTSPRPYLRKRAAALLKVADGVSPTAVAGSGLLRRRKYHTMVARLRRYQADGVAGLVIRPGRGRKPAFSPQYASPAAAQTALLHQVRRSPWTCGYERSRERPADLLSLAPLAHFTRAGSALAAPGYPIQAETGLPP